MDVAVQEQVPATIRSLSPRSYSYEHVVSDRDDEEFSILTKLRRHRILFYSVFTIVMLVDILSFFSVPRTYRADALIEIDTPDHILASANQIDTQLTVGDSADLESQSIILVSPKTLRAVILQDNVKIALLRECNAANSIIWRQIQHNIFDPHGDVSCGLNSPSAETIVESLRGRVTVNVSGRSRVLTLSYWSPLPDVAMTVANAIVETYLETQRREKLRPRDEAVAWLQSQIMAVENRLRVTETSMQSFLHANGVVSGEMAPVASEQLTSLTQQIATAEAERAAATGRMLEAEQSDATTGVLDNRTVNDDKQQLSAINSKIAQLSARYGSAYPPLLDLQQQKKLLEQAVLQDTSVVQRSSVSDYQSATSRVAALAKKLDSIKDEVRHNDVTKTQIASLERSLATDRDLYIDLNRSLSQLETDRKMVTSNVRLISLAGEPTSVFFPKASSFIVTGLLLSVAAATLSALVADRQDKSVRSMAGLQAASELRVFARIPHVSKLGRGASKLPERLATPSPFQESIRRLYAECLLVNAKAGGMKRRPQTLLVTSSDRGEGKTFTTLALAHFAAAAGHRVVVLECDLRQPSIARSLLRLPRWGVSEILRGQVSPEEAILASGTTGFDIIPAGDPVANSLELLSGEHLSKLVSWASVNYDLVLIDSPPAEILPDARIMASVVDGILYCARWGLSDTNLVVRGLQELCNAGGNVVGLVVNDCNLDRFALYDTSALAFSNYQPSK